MAYPLRRMDYSCQCIKLVGERHGLRPYEYALPFADHVHEFDTGQDISGGSKGLEVEHGPGSTLDGPMILLHHIVEILDLPDNGPVFQVGVDVIDGGLVGAALVHGDFVRCTILAHGLVEKAACRGLVALCRQQEVDCIAVLVHGTIQIFSSALDPDIGRTPSLRPLQPQGSIIGWGWRTFAFRF